MCCFVGSLSSALTRPEPSENSLGAVLSRRAAWYIILLEPCKESPRLRLNMNQPKTDGIELRGGLQRFHPGNTSLRRVSGAAALPKQAFKKIGG